MLFPQIISDTTDEPINDGEVYINVMEKDLIPSVEKILSLNLKVGKQVVIISYNEIPITTMSSDFDHVGKIAAELIFIQLKGAC